MTIKFHYHQIGDTRYCHVYSDDFTSSDRGRGELEDWMIEKKIPLNWIHESSLVHLDLWGSKLQHCGKGESSERFVADMRRLRAIQRGETDELHTSMPERGSQAGRHR